jgi:hypothetical protein
MTSKQCRFNAELAIEEIIEEAFAKAMIDPDVRFYTGWRVRGPYLFIRNTMIDALKDRTSRELRRRARMEKECKWRRKMRSLLHIVPM